MTALATVLASASALLVIAVVVLRRRVLGLRIELARERTAADGLRAELVAAQATGAMLSVAVERLPIGVAAFGADGDVLFANQLAARYIGGRHADAVVELQIGRLVAAAVDSSQRQSVDLELHSGGTLHLHVDALPVGQEGDTSAVVVIEDRTDRHRTDRIRRDFVANVSHELKTPLGALSVLAGALEGETNPETRDRLTRRIAEEATRMGRLIEDILDLSRVEGATYEPVVVSLDHVVRRAVARLAATARERAVTVELSLPEQTVYVTGEERQLESAASNLVANAIKFTGAHPAASGRVQVRLGLDGDCAVLTVTDDGVGIAREHLDRIFERFYRADGGRSRDTGGTGLGLAIVRHVAMNHGGAVAVESELGAGSTFTMRLPHDPQLQSVGEEH